MASWSIGARLRYKGPVAIAVFVVLTLLVFRNVLILAGPSRIVSSGDADLVHQFLPLRAFGFGELAHGHVAQWNPYIYGGVPYMAGFQSALFYPPNWLHLVVPLVPAINWLAALHVLLSAVTMYLWVRGRGASVAGGVLAGMMFMFCGPLFLRVYAGHLSHLMVMPWPPLLMLSIDRLAASGRVSWCLVGVAAVAMAILGGSPQYVYYTGLIAAVYTVLLLGRSHRLRLLAGVAAIFVGASLLSAVQLLPGWQASTENVRSGGTDYAFASEFAMPPENLLTALMPGFFGDLPTDTRPQAIGYFGRTNLWETSLFVSVSGLCLAGLSVIFRWRRTWPAVVIVLVSIALALGRHLPIYRPMFDHLPLYGTFRAVAKFAYFAAMFICPLAADGLDLLRSEDGRRRAFGGAIAVGVLSLLLIALALWLKLKADVPHSPWSNFVRFIAVSTEKAETGKFLTARGFRGQSAKYAGQAAMTAGLVAAAAAGLVAASKWWRGAPIALVVLAGLEMFSFAGTSWATTTAKLAYPTDWLTAIRAMPGAYRVVNPGIDARIVGILNEGMILGIRNAWGYDPGVLKRYAEVLTAAERQPVDAASQYLWIDRDRGGIFQMLRCRFELDYANGVFGKVELPDPMPIAQMVPGYTVCAGRDAVLAKLTAADFNPRRTVVLEAPPVLVPSPAGTAGPAQATIRSTDALAIHAVVERPTLLLVTENYSRGWRATAINSFGPQPSYTILPANRTLMAIPLAAGVHDIRLDYQSAGYATGKIVSAVSMVVFLGLTAMTLTRLRSTSEAVIAAT